MMRQVFVITQKETIKMDGYDLDTGNKLYTTQRQTDWDYYISGSIAGWPKIAYGNIYSCSYAGILYCYDARTGSLLWSYGNGGDGNNTSSGIETVWGRYPSFIGAFADGKVFTYVNEHSPNSPMYRGAKFRCINATTGEEIWTLLDMATLSALIWYGYWRWLPDIS
jgi:outer membrane protein assembly factor BamB